MPRAPSTSNSQQPNTGQNPFTFQSPYIANARQPYIANARGPATYQHRSPFTYPFSSFPFGGGGGFSRLLKPIKFRTVL